MSRQVAGPERASLRPVTILILLTNKLINFPSLVLPPPSSLPEAAAFLVFASNPPPPAPAAAWSAERAYNVASAPDEVVNSSMYPLDRQRVGGVETVSGENEN